MDQTAGFAAGSWIVDSLLNLKNRLKVLPVAVLRLCGTGR
jgi:hypothetical protein